MQCSRRTDAVVAIPQPTMAHSPHLLLDRRPSHFLSHNPSNRPSIVCSEHPTTRIRWKRRYKLVGKSLLLEIFSREPGTEGNPFTISCETANNPQQATVVELPYKLEVLNSNLLDDGEEKEKKKLEGREEFVKT